MPRLIPEFSIWFDVPDDELGGRVEIRHIQGGEAQDIFNQSIDARLIATDQGLRQESRHDVAKDSSLTIIKAVKAWENFQDENGVELPCTEANKLRYAQEGWFIEFVSKKRKEVGELFAASQEAKRKN